MAGGGTRAGLAIGYCFCLGREKLPDALLNDFSDRHLSAEPETDSFETERSTGSHRNSWSVCAQSSSRAAACPRRAQAATLRPAGPRHSSRVSRIWVWACHRS